MREIEHDVVALDWRSSKAHSINGNTRQNVAIHTSSMRPAAAISGIHVLGGQMDPVVKQFIPAKYLAGAAALKRLSEEEQEIEDHCGGSVRSLQSVDRDSDRADADTQSSEIQHNLIGNASSVSVKENASMTIDDSGGDTLLHGIVMKVDSKTSSNNDNSPSIVDGFIHIQEEVADEETHDAIVSSESNTVTEIAVDMITEPEIAVDKVIIEDDARQLYSFQLIEYALFGHIDEVIANAYDLSYSDTILMKLSQFRQAFEMIIQSIKTKHRRDCCIDKDNNHSSITEIMREKLTKLLNILHKVFANLMNFPTQERYRSINKSSAIYQNHIQIYDGMLDLLSIVGFQSDDVDINEVHHDRSRKELLMKRTTDQALLYLLCSVLQHMLEIVEKM